MVFADELRTAIPGLRLQANCGGGSFKSQFKRADRSGAAFALVMGEDEVAQQRVLLKPLRERSEQESLSQQDVPARLQGLLALVPAG
jgi:histidyl-tRNA synthetase